jgi:hypothetical protein
MWTLDLLILLTGVSALVVVLLPCVAFYLTVTRCSQWARAAHTLNVSATLAVGVILAVTLNHLWGMKREDDRRVWVARQQHLQQLRVLLKDESNSLDALARSLRQRRYFTLVANDARHAVWRDEALSADIEHHFPEYFHAREDLIQGVLAYDTAMGRVRALVSASLVLPGELEIYRSTLVPALISKCGGADASGLVPHMRNDGLPAGEDDASAEAAYVERSISARDAVPIFERYRCQPDLAATSRNVIDQANDLADQAAIVRDAARRDAEETVLHGSCTYAPAALGASSP